MREKVDELKSINNLRTYCDSLEGAAIDEYNVSAEYVAKGAAIKVRRYAEEIDRELADRYIELPVDADGVPIHVHDKLMTDSEDSSLYGRELLVSAVSEHHIHYQILPYRGDGHYRTGHLTLFRHAKPRTLEDVLREFAQGVSGQNADFADLAAKKYADEIRELLEVKDGR